MRWSRIVHGLSVILSDSWVLAVIVLALAGMCVVGLWKEARPVTRLMRRIRRPMVEAKVEAIRGFDSRASFHVAYGLLSVVLLQVINAAAAGSGYKVVISVVVLAMTAYLTYFNSWSRNKLIAFVIYWRARPG